jgi:hypothetical protein
MSLGTNETLFHTYMGNSLSRLETECLLRRSSKAKVMKPSQSAPLQQRIHHLNVDLNHLDTEFTELE